MAIHWIFHVLMGLGLVGMAWDGVRWRRSHEYIVRRIDAAEAMLVKPKADRQH